MKPLERHHQALIARWLGLIAVAFVLASNLPAQTPPPTVRTDFSIESQLHQENIQPDSERRHFELELSSKLAELCQLNFPFLKWLPVMQEGESPKIQLRLVMKSGSRPEFPPIVLEYETFVAGKKVISRLPVEELYGGFDNQHAHEPEQLKHDILTKIQEQFDTDAFLERLHEGFLQHVSLANVVQLEEPEVIIPVRSDEVHASDRSVLRVSFKSQRGGDLRNGVMRLTPVGQHNGSVSCLVLQVRFAGVMVHPPGGWHPELPQILLEPAIRELHVFMEKYEPQLIIDTTGSLVTKPD